MNRVLSFQAGEGSPRLDVFLAEKTGLPRAQVKRLIEGARVMVAGREARPALRLRSGEWVQVTIPPPQPSQLLPQEMPLKIIYEDSDLAVVDKPPGLPVHPAPGHPSHTLVNALLVRYPELSFMGAPRPGIVHRLDKDTSGLLMVARNEASRLSLARQLKDRAIVKRYLVLVRGRVQPPAGTIDAPLGRHPRNRKKMAVVSGGREARTAYRVLRFLDGFSLLEVSPETGRTHQIRVHLAHIGYPVVGDTVYGLRSPYLARQFLHACYLRFRHPRTGGKMELSSSLPPDLARSLGEIEREGPGEGRSG